jgi:hypothetical protein
LGGGEYPVWIYEVSWGIPGYSCMARYIRTLNKDEQDALFDEIEKNENLSDKGKDFS